MRGEGRGGEVHDAVEKYGAQQGVHSVERKYRARWENELCVGNANDRCESTRCGGEVGLTGRRKLT